MAKVIDPDEKAETAKTVGKSINFSIRGNIKTVRKLPVPSKIPAGFQPFIDAEKEQAETDWRALTDQQKQDWEDEAEDLYTDGPDLFKRERVKETLDNKYNLGYYDTIFYAKS